MLPFGGIIILLLVSPQFIPASHENQPVILTQIGMSGPDAYFDSSTLCVTDHGNRSNQWLVVHNTLNKSIQIDNFGYLASSDVSPGFREGEYYNHNMHFNLGSGQSCTFVLSIPDVHFIQITQNTTISFRYAIQGINYTFTTPPLTDTYNDSRTWQYNGTGWVFTDKQVAVPEFPFAIPILLISITSLIVFYRIVIRK
jgi:hypothetical protein